MPYIKNVWVNGDPTKPVNASRLGHGETQYDEAMADVEAAIGDAGTGIGAALSSKIGSVTAADIAAPDGAIPTAIGRRVKVAKSVGDTVAIGDLLKASAWSSGTDFRIPLAVPTDVPAGSEFVLSSEGAGVGRVVAAEENLFPYPDAVAGFAGGIWSVRGSGALSVVAGVGPGGMSVIRATASAASSSGGFGHAGGTSFGNFTLQALGLKAGDVISSRAWLAPPAAGNGRIQFRFYAGTVIVSEPSTSNTSGNGYRYATNVTIPDGVTHFVIVSYSTAAASGDTSDITDIRVIRGSSAVASSITGDSTNGRWWGTANASPSSIGRVLGDPLVPAGGRSILRYEGSGTWRVTPVGPSTDTLRASAALAVDRDNGQAGMYAPSSPFTTSDTALTSGRAVWVRVVPSRDMLIQGIGFRVTTASGTDDECSVGLYNSVGTRLVTSGAVTGYLNSTGQKLVPIAATLLKAGFVYYAAMSSASTAAVRRGTVLADAFGTAIPALECGYASTNHPIPSTIPGLTTSDAPVLLVLREFT